LEASTEQAATSLHYQAASPDAVYPVESGEVPISVSLGELPEAHATQSSAACVQLLFDNTTASGSWYRPGTGIEVIDFGTAAGGTVCKFKFAYATTLSDPGTISVTFYSGTTTSVCPGTFLAGWTFSGLSGSPDGQPRAYTYDFTIPSGQEFNLPAGPFGYGYEFANAETGTYLASGGTGDTNGFWEACSLTWFGGNPWAGFYMRITAQELAPPDMPPPSSELNPASNELKSGLPPYR